MIEYFEQREIDSPRVVAEMLLAHILQCERMRLYMEVDRPASPDELARLRDLVRRAANDEPVQYLVGEAWFFAKPFAVDRSTLIPRPSTETLVECVTRYVRSAPGYDDASDGPLVLDVGTGTGCIAISLALQLPHARAIATDIEPQAIDLARGNAERHRVTDRITFNVGNLFEPVRERPEWGQFNVICANPPYISDAEWVDPSMVGRNVRHQEPERALRGGPDGLAVIRPLIEQATRALAPGGLLAVEIGHAQRQAVIDLVAAQRGLGDPRVVKDQEGYWRVLLAERDDAPS